MKNITLTTNRSSASGEAAKVLLNWDNVNWAKTSVTPYGDSYVEVNLGGNHTITVTETLEEIGDILNAE